jgi:hypothetical protein
MPVLISVAALTATACIGDGHQRKQLVPPSPEARAAAIELKRDFPEARVFFSQNSGEILWIDGGGGALEQGISQTPAQALAVVQRFFARYPKLFRITGPSSSLASAEGGLSVNSGANSLTTLRFTQLQAGTPIANHFGTAVFDSNGRLLGLQTHLLPDADFEAEIPSQGTASARLAPSADAPGSRRAWRRVLRGYQLMDERVEQNGIEVRRVLSDPRTGEALRTFDETPSELTTAPSGWTSAAAIASTARDSLGNLITIPSTRSGGTLVLGFHLDGIHAEGKAVVIADAGSSASRDRVPMEPLASLASSWVDERAFDPDLTAATTLAAHVRTTLQWFGRELGWASWNGRGNSLYTAIRGRRSGSKPELNAWGGGGQILIGDGVSETGQPLSDALDVVAHEFTHSLIGATAQFRYYSESGALNESLADFFGKAVQGFPDTIEGSQAGVHLRDLADPESCRTSSGGDCSQPGHYSGFEIREDGDDSAGVHTNSGIVNRALTQVVLQRPSATPLAQLILDSLGYAGFDTNSTLEDFAAGLTGYCLALERGRTLLASQAGLCALLEASFTETELLGPAL